MSENYLVVIPRDPHADLPKTAQKVRHLLAQMADTDQARVKDYGKLQFIDCGEAFEHVACPSCKTQLSIAKWHALMDQDWHGEDGFHLQSLKMPCCSVSHSIDALTYVTPQGFSKWLISAKATNRSTLSHEELATLEAAAGMPLRAINQRY